MCLLWSLFPFDKQMYIHTRTGFPKLLGPALGCLRAIDKKSAYYFVNITLLVFLIGQNSGYNCSRRQVKICLQLFSFHHQRLCWATSTQYILATDTCPHDVPHTHDVSLPAKFRFNVGLASQPIAGEVVVHSPYVRRASRLPSQLVVQCQQIVYDSGPTLLQHWVCCILRDSTPAKTCHTPNVGPTSSTLARN